MRRSTSYDQDEAWVIGGGQVYQQLTAVLRARSGSPKTIAYARLTLIFPIFAQDDAWELVDETEPIILVAAKAMRA